MLTPEMDPAELGGYGKRLRTSRRQILMQDPKEITSAHD